MSRIASVVVPELPLQALLRSEPELHGTPLGVVVPEPNASKRPAARMRGARIEPPLTARLVAVSDAASQLGVHAGQTVVQARATAPQAIIRSVGAEQVAAARAALVDAAFGFAPRVEPDGDSVYLDVGDLGRLFPSERDLALGLVARVRAVGLEAGVGIAASKGVAKLAALTAGSGELRLVAAGNEARFVAPLPIVMLARALGLEGPLIADALAALSRWGIGDAARLVALPEREVALRLGAAGSRLWRLAAGRSDEPLAPRAPEVAVEEGMELDYALGDLEALAFVLRGLVDRVLARLAARHLACAGLALRLKLESGAHDVREIPVAAPTREAASLLQLTRLSLERKPPDAGVVGVTLLGHAACARADQLDLFRPAGPSPERLSTTVARLQALVGDDAVGSPRVMDSHREEAIGVIAYRPANAAAPTSTPVSTECGALAFRHFRPEREVEVLVDGGAVPRALSGNGLASNLVVAAGPFRARGEWWAGGGYARDYWDVHASDGALYRLFQDGRGRWFVAGYYD